MPVGKRKDRGRPVDPLKSIDRLLHDLRTGRDGLSDREAARRLVVFGPNELVRRAGRSWLRDPRQVKLARGCTRRGPDGHRVYTVAQIAAEFGAGQPTIYRHLERSAAPVS